MSLSDEERAVIDAVKAVVGEHLPIVGELCRIDPIDATLEQPDPRCRCDGPLLG